MNLYDVHSHILPQIDDGAENVDVSVNIINTLYNQGVRHICLTPHYYTHQESMDSFLTHGKFILPVAEHLQALMQ